MPAKPARGGGRDAQGGDSERTIMPITAESKAFFGAEYGGSAT